MSNSTLYPDVLKIKTNCCETKFYKNAICLLFTHFQIHHLATLLPGRPSNRVARYGFVNKKMAFLKNFVWQQSLFCFQNIWIQCRIRHILSTLKQILEISTRLDFREVWWWSFLHKKKSALIDTLILWIFFSKIGWFFCPFEAI